MNRTTSALTIFAVAGALTIAGCSTDSDSEPTTPDMPATTADATTPDATTSDATTSETTTPDGSDATAMETTESDLSPVEPTASEITVTVGGTDTVVTPDQVYCSGEEGNLRHIIGKTNNQPPLVEATPGEFAMVKLDQNGAPYKADSPTGITFGDTSATFDETVLGDATVNGTLTCTVWED